MRNRSWLTTIMALATHTPRHDTMSEISCTTRGSHEVAVAWATSDRFTGITWWFERRDLEGRAIGQPVELGWGYDGAEICALGYQAGRYLATWAWWDPYGGRPELRTAVVAKGHRISAYGAYLGPYSDIEPVQVTPTRRGWTIDYRFAHEGEVHRIDADLDGRLRR